jgi:hypothetical protein
MSEPVLKQHTRGGDFYVTGGTLRPDAPSYVERQADRELCRGLLEGEFCYVLTSRQMGKSSLMVRAVKHLRDEGVAVAVLDLTAIGQNLSIDQWYDGLISRLGQQLDLEDELLDFWEAHPELGPLQRWLTALEKVVLVKLTSRVVIFVDEIDIVRSLPFSTDEFFAAIREAYNRRSREPMLNRLAFGLLGVAAPTDLIRDTRMTPFNIGRRIELHDFTAEEAAPLARGLGPEEETARGLLERVLYWTGGHPYLTQRLCRALAETLKSGERGNDEPLALALALNLNPNPISKSEPRPQLPPKIDNEDEEHSAGSSSPLGSLNHSFAMAPAAADQPLARHSSSGGGSTLNQVPPVIPTAGSVDELAHKLFLSRQARERDDNLIFVRERLLRGEQDVPSLLYLYRRVWRGQPVADDDTNPLITILKLSGIALGRDGNLSVRNRIYQHVFDPAWIQTNLPEAEVRRQQVARRRGVALGLSIALVILLGYLFVRPMVAEYRKITLTRGTVQKMQDAYRGLASYRDTFDTTVEIAVGGTMVPTKGSGSLLFNRPDMVHLELESDFSTPGIGVKLTSDGHSTSIYAPGLKQFRIMDVMRAPAPFELPPTLGRQVGPMRIFPLYRLFLDPASLERFSENAYNIAYAGTAELDGKKVRVLTWEHSAEALLGPGLAGFRERERRGPRGEGRGASGRWPLTTNQWQTLSNQLSEMVSNQLAILSNGLPVITEGARAALAGVPGVHMPPPGPPPGAEDSQPSSMGHQAKEAPPRPPRPWPSPGMFFRREGETPRIPVTAWIGGDNRVAQIRLDLSTWAPLLVGNASVPAPVTGLIVTERHRNIQAEATPIDPGKFGFVPGPESQPVAEFEVSEPNLALRVPVKKELASMIPRRLPSAPEGLIDLTPYFNASLLQTWHPGLPENSLNALPTGILQFGELAFDVRGVVQVSGKGLEAVNGNFPRKLVGIKIDQTCRALQFLQATGWREKDGTRVGAYILHYIDGETVTLPLIYGEDLRDWNADADPSAHLTRASIVWSAINNGNRRVRIFKMAWENPRPEKEIATLDFESAMSDAAPFLLALTAER